MPNRYQNADARRPRKAPAGRRTTVVTRRQAAPKGPGAGLVVLLVAALAVLAIVAALAVANCSGDAGAERPHGQDGLGTAVTSDVPEDEGDIVENEMAQLTPNREGLAAVLEDEDVDKLMAAAEQDLDARWIAAHPEAFDFEGPEVEYKILKLAADEPASYAYVREFPEKFPADDQVKDPSIAMSTASPSPDVPDTAIPHLYQWDRRWAQTVYCSTTFGLTACGPASLAMVYQGLLGRDDLTPYDLGIEAQQRGYMQQFDGTDSAFFTDVATDLGLGCEALSPSAETIVSELASGHAIIANLAPGYFTRYGHFFVLAGLTEDGKVIINDPYSVVRSGQTWDPEFIASESRVLYSYSA